MDKIIFFDVSINGENKKFDGKEIFIDDLIQLRQKQNPDVFKKHGFVSKMNDYSFLLFKRDKKWNKAVATMIFCLSGQVPSRREIVDGRTLLENLPKEFKREFVDRRFVLCFLPYLMIGFRQTLSSYQENANSVEDMVRVVLKLYDKNCHKVWTFLCSHREAEIIEPYSIVKKLDFNRLRKALNLNMGLVANSIQVPRKIVWLQQFATEKASSSLFPEVFIRYLRKGNVPDLLALLERHSRQIRSYFLQRRLPSIDLELRSLDGYTDKIDFILEKEYGVDWREKISLHLSSEKSVIKRLVFMALPDIKRFMPYFGLNKNQQLNLFDKEVIQKNKDRAIQIGCANVGEKFIELTENCINWFFENQCMDISTKALYETMFYFYCGQKTARENSVYLAFERDHSLFQVETLREGYSYEKKIQRQFSSGFPFIFARHNYKEAVAGTLIDISFRQFWRLSQGQANILQGGKKWEEMEESKARSVFA